MLPKWLVQMRNLHAITVLKGTNMMLGMLVSSCSCAMAVSVAGICLLQSDMQSLSSACKSAHLLFWLLRIFSISVMLFSIFIELTVSTFASLKTSLQSWMLLSADVLLVPGASSGQGDPEQGTPAGCLCACQGILSCNCCICSCRFASAMQEHGAEWQP